jgi:ketosteroid isomerase-like protein
MSSSENDVRRAVDAWFAALNAMLAGNPEPFSGLCSHAGDVIYMSGEGTYRVGFEAAFADWKEQAAKARGGQVTAEDVHVVVTGDMAAAGLVAHARFKDRDGRQSDLRVRQTNVYRKEGADWKLVLHQADFIPAWRAVVS